MKPKAPLISTLLPISLFDEHLKWKIQCLCTILQINMVFTINAH